MKEKQNGRSEGNINSILDFEARVRHASQHPCAASQGSLLFQWEQSPGPDQAGTEPVADVSCWFEGSDSSVRVMLLVLTLC